MKIHIVTIFPESFSSYFSTSIMKNAISKWLFFLEFYKLNDFSDNKTKRVDEKAYWTHGQIISPEPLAKTIEYIFEKVWKKIPVLYMSPKWDLLTQKKVEKYFKKLDEFIVICGHYEGIDERIVDLYIDYEISIWKYIISSWELAASIFIDAFVRNIPWVLWNKESLEEESFSKKLDRKKEYPQYTKPRIFLWKKVPEVLFSWNHWEIQKWKKNNLK
jgi:tRNA (guanine37-N1)-methyltransferase